MKKGPIREPTCISSLYMYGMIQRVSYKLCDFMQDCPIVKESSGPESL